ncbi:MAG: hypothetical protein GKC06_04255, partial [Methanomicrobiales archaeon]|nr:hypothetical protein [Methanomicrobiales archaeon]
MTPHRIAAAHQDLMNAGRQITLVLSFTGHLDHHAVKNALRALLEVEPVLGCRLVGEGKKASWERREDLSSLDLLTVEEESAPDDAVKRFPDDQLVQGLLVRGEEGDTLCISVSHAVTDVTGARDLIPALADLYTRYRAEPDFWPLQGGYSDRGSWQLIDSAGLIETIGTIPAASPPEPVFRGPVGAVRPAGETTGDEPGRPGGAIAMQVIGPERFRAIREAADSRGATMTDVLLTAFFRALCRTLHPPEEVPLPLEVSVNMRYLLPEEEFRRIANLSSAVFPALAWIPDEQFRTTLTRAKEQMDDFNSGYPGLPFILHTSVATGAALRQPEDAFIPRLEYHDLSGESNLVFGDIPVSSAYLLCHGEGPVLCASVFRDILTLAAGFPGGSREIVDAIVRELDHLP